MNPFRTLWQLASNHFTASPVALAIGFASNIRAEAIGDSEWLKLSPFFEGDYWENEKGKWNKYRQVVTRAHGDRLVTAFNSLRTSAGANFRGLPIYRGHPDADPARWPDESRLGGVMELEARDDGLFAKVAWNDEGERNRAQGYLVYPSPAWPYDLKLKAQTGRIEPVELRSIGMTNTPRISGVPAWTNSEGAPCDTLSTPENPTNDNHTTMKELLRKLLGLPETATDEEITSAANAAAEKKTAMNAAPVPRALAVNINGKAFGLLLPGDAPATLDGEVTTAIQALATNAAALPTAQAELDTARKSFVDAKADADKFRKLAINSALATAINARRITAAEQPEWEGKLAVNFDEAAQQLGAKAATLPNEPLNLQHRTGDISTPAGRQLAFNTMVDAHVSKGLSIDQAMDAIRVTPEGAALLTAMQPAPAKSV